MFRQGLQTIDLKFFVNIVSFFQYCIVFVKQMQLI